MIHNLFIFTAFINLFAQAYLVLLTLSAPLKFFALYGLSLPANVLVNLGGVSYLRLWSFGLVAPILVVMIFALVWLWQRKQSGRFILGIIGLIWFVVGISAFFGGKRYMDLFYIEGLRGMALFLVFLLDATIGRRKKYLFHVKR